MSKVSVKKDESALFRSKRGFKGQRRHGTDIRDGKHRKSYEEWQKQLEGIGPQLGGACRDCDKDDNEDKSNRRRNGSCYICGKVGHYWECRLKRVEGIIAASKENDSKEEWDFKRLLHWRTRRARSLLYH